MPQIRIRVELFKGQESVDINRLASIPDELSKLFRCIGEDAGILPADNHWRASEFSNGSLDFNAATADELPSHVVNSCNRIATAVFAGKPQDAYSHGVSDRTLLQYGQLAKKIQPGEKVLLGVYETRRATKPKHLYLVTADVVQRLTESVRVAIDYHGTILGVVHSLYKEAERPHFDLRDMARGDLVKCYFGREHYADVVTALFPRERKVHVSGVIRANRLDKNIDSILVDKIELVDPMTDDEFEKFFGSAPDMTDGRSAEEFVSAVRDDEY